MNGYDAYQQYLALRTHFTTKRYDYFKYSGEYKLKLSPIDFKKDKSRILYDRLARKYKKLFPDFVVANLVRFVGDTSVHELTNASAHRNFMQWRKTEESFTYLYKEDLKEIFHRTDDFRRMLKSENPVIISMVLSGTISFQTFSMLCEILKLHSLWDKTFAEDPVWEDLSLRTKKYTNWLPKKHEYCKSVLREMLNTEAQN